jgi:hypothetical protein
MERLSIDEETYEHRPLRECGIPEYLRDRGGKMGEDVYA